MLILYPVPKLKYDKMEKPGKKKSVGRPRKYANDRERVQASRERRRLAGVRWDLFVNRNTRTRLQKFAKREGLSVSDALGLLTYNCLTAEGKRKNWFSLESMGDFKKSNSISSPDTK